MVAIEEVWGPVRSGGLVMTSLGLSLSLSVFADLGRVEDLGFAGLVALVSSKILVSAPICFLVCGGCTLPVQMWGLHFLGAVRQPIKRGSKSFRPLISSSVFM
ncbi:hypothetical protein F2Q68_00023685 [Brassica cretica]|uniref:Uncharacterized protein n=1 Tax=Brassica cretica TaxID=69181 RepID=A0A8S9I6E6_BRACR|nr:hypothetical protein F2Q68_00023685 [Brassica cretica]